MWKFISNCFILFLRKIEIKTIQIYTERGDKGEGKTVFMGKSMKEKG